MPQVAHMGHIYYFEDIDITQSETTKFLNSTISVNNPPTHNCLKQKYIIHSIYHKGAPFQEINVNISVNYLNHKMEFIINTMTDLH